MPGHFRFDNVTFRSGAAKTGAPHPYAVRDFRPVPGHTHYVLEFYDQKEKRLIRAYSFASPFSHLVPGRRYDIEGKINVVHPYCVFFVLYSCKIHVAGQGEDEDDQYALPLDRQER